MNQGNCEYCEGSGYIKLPLSMSYGNPDYGNPDYEGEPCPDCNEVSDNTSSDSVVIAA